MLTETLPPINLDTLKALDLGKHAVTIWKDGSYKIWGAMDAHYAQSDPDYLATIGVAEMVAGAVADHVLGTLVRATENPPRD